MSLSLLQSLEHLHGPRGPGLLGEDLSVDAKDGGVGATDLEVGGTDLEVDGKDLGLP